MTILGALGRRRTVNVSPFGGYKASIPSGDHTAHGGGYPLTYHFTIPAGSGFIGQWRDAPTKPWRKITAAPSGRFDGITAARFATGHAYLSIPFTVDSPDLYLRVVDGSGAEVGTFADVSQHYDNRTAALAFTYDDTSKAIITAAQYHAVAGIWMSPGINAGTLDTTGDFDPVQLSPAQLAATVAAGYVEPVNHSLTHVNATNYTDLNHARAEIVGGKDGILAATAMPPQSRGRVHSYIYPHGTYNDWAFQAVGEAGHLTARMTLSQNSSVEQGTYTPGAWSETWQTVPIQLPSVAMALTDISGDAVAMAAAAQKVLDGVAHAKSVGGQCIVYSYTYLVSWAADSPWRAMLTTLGADLSLWSVGYGHLALYQRTRDRVTVTAVTE